MKLLLMLFSVLLIAKNAYANDYRDVQAQTFLENIYRSPEPAKAVFVNKIFTPKFQQKIKSDPALFHRILNNFKKEKTIMQSPDTHAGVTFTSLNPSHVKLIYLLNGKTDPTQAYILFCPRGNIPNGTCLIDDIL